MKTILFLANNNLIPTSGGLERTTFNLINWLANNSNFRIIVCFKKIDKAIDNRTHTIEKITYNGDDIKRIIERENVDVVIFPAGAWYVNEFKKIRHESNAKVITCLHIPLEAGRKSQYLKIRLDLKNRNLLKKVIYIPKALKILFKEHIWKVRRGNPYKKGYENSDLFVLLSKSYFKSFIRITKIKNENKLRAIGNALSFPEILSEQELAYKKNQLLVVARMDELSKRISLILRIWKEVERQTGWELHLVGDGSNLKEYVEFSKENNLKKIFFHGRQDPYKYYCNSKIFLMTSNFEGWGMTLTEAIQTGCVPVVMDTFGALHEIVENNYNGFIVKNNDEKEFISKILFLIENANSLLKMQKNALKSSEKFTINEIGKKWIGVINEL